jgi:hypothetical protein
MRIIFDPLRLEVTVRGRTIVLPPMEFEMLKMIDASKSGISPKRISDNQYQLDPNGGPDIGGYRVVHQRRVHLNRKIKPLGIKIMAHKKGLGGVYEIRKISHEHST